MSINVVRIKDRLISIVVDGEIDVAAFDKLISRGISTWDQAAPEIKIAADEIRYGKALQDYVAQNPKATHNS